MYGIIVKTNKGYFFRNVSSSLTDLIISAEQHYFHFTVLCPGELTDCYVFELDDPTDLDECVHSNIIKDFLKGEEK